MISERLSKRKMNIKIIKSVVVFLLVAVLVFCFAGCSGDNNTDLTKFNGFSFGDTYKKVAPKIDKWLLKQDNYSKLETSGNYIKNRTAVEMNMHYSSIQVFDYQAREFTTSYIGKETDQVNDCVFYKVTYYIVREDPAEAEEVYKDLSEKLTNLYGDPTFESTKDPLVCWESGDYVDGRTTGRCYLTITDVNLHTTGNYHPYTVELTYHSPSIYHQTP